MSCRSHNRTSSLGSAQARHRFHSVETCDAACARACRVAIHVVFYASAVLALLSNNDYEL